MAIERQKMFKALQSASAVTAILVTCALTAGCGFQPPTQEQQKEQRTDENEKDAIERVFAASSDTYWVRIEGLPRGPACYFIRRAGMESGLMAYTPCEVLEGYRDVVTVNIRDIEAAKASQ